MESSSVVKALESKFDPREVEKEVIRFWDENKIYTKLKENNSKMSKKFLFIDGPPYPSAPVPHIGTIWNKVIKDCILRFKRLEGYKVNDQPGYDTHGLPIEVAVEKRLGITRKQEIYQIGVEKFVNACKDFALTNLSSMTQNFRNVGIFMDWENPYLTLDSNYISNSWAVIKRAHERGLLEKGVQVLHWCPRCETTLSDYEVSEYKELEDPSIYVKFKLRGEDRKYLVIWTTTPWTLPSNVFVMINKDYEYAEVEANGEVYVIARARVEEVMKEARIQKYSIKRTFKGDELLGVEYEHPLKDLVEVQRDLDRYHVVVDAGQNVTLQEGTGLVHSAPGHGDVDFEVGKSLNFPLVMFVNDRGEFTEQAGKYKGLYVRDASEKIIEDLRARNALLASSKIVHRYPICWRCKSPLILRAIEQWFVKVSVLKSDLLNEIEKVNWVPSWGKTRIGNMVREIRDWVISRQRFWGNPLPIWICDRGHVTVVGSVKELKEIALTEIPKELHKPWIDSVTVKCSVCGLPARRIPDVADVWFDSGVAFFASLGEDWQKKWQEWGPVDLVLEGHDQLRGWFFSLLRSGVILEGKSPYSAVLVHGFMLDEQGREMHKSLGNYVEPSVVIEKFGRDTLRLMLLRNTTWEDMRFSWRNLELNLRDLQIAWNVFLFTSLYMNLDEFRPSSLTLEKAIENARVEDLWLLSRFYSMEQRVIEAMKDFKVHELANELVNFIVDDVSRFYLRLARKRAWQEGSSLDKTVLYTVLYHVLKSWLIMASAVIPHFAEKVYQNFVVDGKRQSVSMEDLPRLRTDLIDPDLEKLVSLAKEIAEAGLNARAKANIKLRWPILTAHLFIGNGEVRERLTRVTELLKSLLNVKEVKFYGMSEFEKFSELKVQPNRGAIGRDFKRLSPKVLRYIEENKDLVAKDVLKHGKHMTSIDGEDIILTGDHVNVSEEVKGEYVSSAFSSGILVMLRQVTPEEEEEGIMRDIIRRIQYMRKIMNLNVTDYVIVNILPPDDRRGVIEKYKEYIMSETRAKELSIGEGGDLVNSWDIEGENYVIGVRKAT
ncbi:isoleucyl-tRNA synthetase [Metallosphaera yellowstonensis MK1]|uniref:Isoleucine--tRNA ligase n=1 Tax=Metallosphaera yellowstonensis MK1 TaxID=671065 RepID=H2C6K4_9CREN|nr:isoleucine--tRNA ligase [Metallosphaera yellowstonensis]EHP69431.1 isoleucyl-tRNA synthetase [Metallosphaera yellowstonensis MK1]